MGLNAMSRSFAWCEMRGSCGKVKVSAKFDTRLLGKVGAVLLDVINRVRRASEQAGKIDDWLMLDWLAKDAPDEVFETVLRNVRKAWEFSLSIDPIVKIDRAGSVVFPDWANKDWISDPEFIALQKWGPESYDSTKLVRWLHPNQPRQPGVGFLSGKEIFDYLKGNGLLVDCLGLKDLNAIREKGPEFFHYHFPHQTLYGWKSAVRLRDTQDMRVPFLCENSKDGDGIGWRSTTIGYGHTDFAARFGLMVG